MIYRQGVSTYKGTLQARTLHYIQACREFLRARAHTDKVSLQKVAFIYKGPYRQEVTTVNGPLYTRGPCRQGVTTYKEPNRQEVHTDK